MRTDLSIYNEACGFSIHSKSMCGKTREELVEDTLFYVRQGVVIPIQLVQDDPFTVRGLLGELSEAEEQEWVGKIEWKLKVPCGVLAIEGGLDPDTEDEPEEDDNKYVYFVDIPSGDYRVVVYTYFHSING